VCVCLFFRTTHSPTLFRPLTHTPNNQPTRYADRQARHKSNNTNNIPPRFLNIDRIHPKKKVAGDVKIAMPIFEIVSSSILQSRILHSIIFLVLKMSLQDKTCSSLTNVALYLLVQATRNCMTTKTKRIFRNHFRKVEGRDNDDVIGDNAIRTLTEYKSDNLLENIWVPVMDNEKNENITIVKLLQEMLNRTDMKENWEYAKLVIESMDEDSKKRLSWSHNDGDESSKVTAKEQEEEKDAAQQRQQNALEAMRKRQAQFEDMLVSSSEDDDDEEEEEEEEVDEEDEEEADDDDDGDKMEEDEKVNEEEVDPLGGSTGIVRIQGMISEKGIKLNNKRGRIISWNHEKKRYAVQMEVTRTKCWIKPSNLILIFNNDNDDKTNDICCLCRESKEDEVLCLISLLQYNNGFNRENCTFMGPKPKVCRVVAPVDFKSCLFRSCGHLVHASCRNRYFLTLYQRYHRGQPFEGQRVVNMSSISTEYICPVCRRLANCIVPIVPSANIMVSSTQCVDNFDNIFKYILGDEETRTLPFFFTFTLPFFFVLSYIH